MEPDIVPGDAGALGNVFDTITGTVNSIERFGDTVKDATSFTINEAMIWAIILFMFFTLFVRLARPWNDVAADKWRQGHLGAPRPKRASQKDFESRIEMLEAQLGEALAKLASGEADSTGADAPSMESVP